MNTNLTMDEMREAFDKLSKMKPYPAADTCILTNAQFKKIEAETGILSLDFHTFGLLYGMRLYVVEDQSKVLPLAIELTLAGRRVLLVDWEVEEPAIRLDESE